MEAERLRIINVLKIEQLDIRLGKITRISGKNDTGKSSTLAAVKSLIEGGTDATLLRQGAEEGEVVLILNDGLELREDLTPGKQERSVIHPEFGPQKRPQTIIDSLITPSSFNPAEFLTAKPERQKELVLQALPLTVTAEQLQETTGYAPRYIILPSTHGLQAIAAHHQDLYDARTNHNRDLKQKQAAAQQIEESLPKAPPEGDWTAELKQCERQVKALEEELRGRKQMAERQSAEDLVALNRDADAQIEEFRRGTQVQIRELERILMEQTEGTRQVAAQMAAEKRDTLKGDFAVIEEHVSPKLQEWVQKAEHARTMAEQDIRAESARTLLKQMMGKAKQDKSESDRLTVALKRLAEFKAKITASLPIADLEIKPDGLFYRGFPIARNAESARVTLAVELAALQAGKLGLILVDGVECLDQGTQALLEEIIQSKPGLRAILARTTEDETLTVTTEG